jgi:hypothetical protein
MFNCLKEKKMESKYKFEVGMKLFIERSYLDCKKYYYLEAMVVSIAHPKFIVLEIKHPTISNLKYIETVFKQEFQLKFKNQILKL